jgi:hypothetical protein
LNHLRFLGEAFSWQNHFGASFEPLSLAAGAIRSHDLAWAQKAHVHNKARDNESRPTSEAHFFLLEAGAKPD